MACAAPTRSAAAHLSADPAVTMTVSPSTCPSWIAVTPMPLVPPWTRIVSPARARPRSTTFDQTVNQVSGRLAAPVIAIPAGTGRHWPAGGDAIFGIAAARDQRADRVAGPPTLDAVTDGGNGARNLQPHDRRRAGRHRVHPHALQHVGAVDPCGGDLDEHLARAGFWDGAGDRDQHLRASGCGGVDCGHGGGNGHAADIDLEAARVNVAAMFDEPEPPRRRSEPLADLAREDLDRQSIAELEDRVVALEHEIARTRAKLAGATQFLSAADSLFKK